MKQFISAWLSGWAASSRGLRVSGSILQPRKMGEIGGRTSPLRTSRRGPTRLRRRCFEVLQIESMESRHLLASDLLITEFAASNQFGLTDDDGDRSDWIEIYNQGTETRNLEGFYLTDDPQDLTKWRFPEKTIDAKAFEIVFASGKDRRASGHPFHTSFRLRSAGESLMLIEPDGTTIAFSYTDFPAQYADISFGKTQPIVSESVIRRDTLAKFVIPSFDDPGNDTDWTATHFNDTTWNDGVGSIGYDHTNRLTDLIDTDVQNEMQNINTSAYVRYRFPMDDVSAIQGLQLQMRYDDGYVAYLNGIEVARRNAPDELDYEARASASRSNADKPVAEPVDISAFLDLLVIGENVLAVHGLNRTARSSFFVSPELVVQRPGDVNLEQSRFFETPTPGEINGDVSYGGVLGGVEISLAHGFYETAQETTITSDTPGAAISYTVDGSTPTLGNGIIVSPADPTSTAVATISVENTTILRATAVRDDHISAQPATATYVFVDDVITQSPDGRAPEGWPARRVNGQIFTYGMDPDVVEDPRYAPVIRDALLDISSISIVTDPNHLFDPDTGFYVNGRTAGDGIPAEWERPTSVELIHPDGTQGFQIDAGIRMRGGASRSPENPKHAFRLFFRGEYGATKLRYPLFGDEGVDEFDGIDLRTPSLISWHWCFPGSERFRCENNTFLRDVFARDTQRDMGHPYTRSRHYHVYLNGQYWGLYQSQERPEASYAESYFGGDKLDYDVIKVERGEPRFVFATDGRLDAWRQLWEQAIGGFESDEAYFRARGLNPDGSRNQDYPVLLNVENLIDYMILQLYGGNLDGPISDNIGNTQTNNWIAIRNRTTDEGFLFFAHDSEYILLNVEENRNGHWPVGENFENSNPQWLHQQLSQNRLYREMFADRVYKHLFNDGALTPEASLARLQTRIDEIDLAIIAESARWGDSNRRTPFTREDWQVAVSHIVDTYIPQRTPIFLEQLKNTTVNGFSDLTAPLFPNVNAPVFSQHGGQVDPGFELAIRADDQVFFTFDGSDPKLRLPTIDFDPLVKEGDALHYLVPTDDVLDQQWTSPEFDVATWTEGVSAVGFEQDSDVLTDAISTDLNASMHSVNSSVYVRIPFSVPAPNAYDVLELALQYDDGFVAYLNGSEVARSNVEGDPSWESVSSIRRTSTFDIRAFESIDLSDHLDLLRAGDNVLAILGVNRSANDGDFFLLPELRAGVIRESGVAASALAYTNPIKLDANTVVSARALRGHRWSALNRATFTVESLPLRISEIMYHPLASSDVDQAAGFVDDDDFEYIELTNRSETEVIDLSGMTLSEGIDFTFPALEIGPQQFVIVARNTDAFRHRYGNVGTMAGQYGNAEGGDRLSNSGETVRLSDAAGILIQEIVYADSWYPETDGDGYALQARADVQPEDWSAASGWRASFLRGGSPGSVDRLPGDVNRDGVFDSRDLVIAFQAGEYEDEEEGNSSFDEGDWNADGDFNSRDLVLAFQLGTFQPNATEDRTFEPNSVINSIRRKESSAGAVDRLFNDIGQLE